jgi:hAT family C-terminal dimerisation region
MLERALYLRPAIDHFLRKNQKLSKLALSDEEWDRCELVLAILRPFRTVSTKLQATIRPGIDKVFFYYENLFDQIDKVKIWIDTSINEDNTAPPSKPWLPAVKIAVDAMAAKLSKHYNRTGKSFIYADACILNPMIKMSIFQQESWKTTYGNGDKYRKECRQRFMRDYQHLSEKVPSSPSIGQKRKHAATYGDDDYEKFIQSMQSKITPQNEFDAYLKAGPVLLNSGVQSALNWWAKNKDVYPALSRMARDTLAVPCTGAGVEREFSKSRRVTPWTRNRLNPDTISEIMMYKNYLHRHSGLSLDWDGLPEDIEAQKEAMEENEVPVTWSEDWWNELVG